MTTFERRVQAGQLFILFLGFCWGIYEFSVKEYLRTLEPPAIALSAKLEELDRHDCMVLLRAHLDVTNRGNGQAWIPALWWNVYGLRLQGTGYALPEFVKTTRLELNNGQQGFARFSSVAGTEIVAIWRNLDFEYYFNTHDEARLEDLFLVPEDQFDYLQVFVQAYVARNIDPLSPTQWEITEEGNLEPQLEFKKEGRIDLENKAHRKLLESFNIVSNIDVASLRLKSSKGGCKARKNQ